MNDSVGFPFKGWGYQYKALPFGLSLSSRFFMKVVEVALLPIKEHSICILNYLDDWLISSSSTGFMADSWDGRGNMVHTGGQSHLPANLQQVSGYFISMGRSAPMTGVQACCCIQPTGDSFGQKEPALTVNTLNSTRVTFFTHFTDPFDWQDFICSDHRQYLNNQMMADSDNNSFYRPIPIVGPYIGACLVKIPFFSSIKKLNKFSR